LALGCAAQPGIGQNGVVNAASLIPPTLPGGAIARGALFIIHGVRLGSSGRSVVTVSRNGVTTRIRVLKIDARRIDALMPASAPLGSGGLVVTVDGQTSRPFPIEVVASNPGVFSRNEEGWGPGHVDNVLRTGGRITNSTTHPALPGQQAILLVTGLSEGPSATVVVGNRTAKAEATRLTEHPGEEEVAFRIPLDAPQGCFVPLYLMAAPARASNVTTISIHSGAGPCNAGPAPLLGSEKIGVVALSRTQMKARKEHTADAVSDDARISFSATENEPVLTPLRLLPPAGACTAYTSSYQADTDLSTSISSILGPGGRGLDAGSKLTVVGAAGSRSIGETYRNPGYYRARLGSAGISHQETPLPLFLEPGEVTLQGTGGKDVGPFTVLFHVPAPFDWTDRDATSVVDRRRGVTVHWKGTTRDQVMLIVARNIDQITTAIGLTVCVAKAPAGQFTLPPELLANVPITRDMPGTPYDELVIGALEGTLPSIRATGLSGGFVLSVYATGRIVEYR
jgi:uncharacterized protein (TIGR03437 family)